MKSVYFSLLLVSSALAFGQTSEADRLKRFLVQTRIDTTCVLLQVQLAHCYLFFQPDSAIILAQQALQQIRKLTFAKGESRALNELSVC